MSEPLNRLLLASKNLRRLSGKAGIRVGPRRIDISLICRNMGESISREGSSTKSGRWKIMTHRASVLTQNLSTDLYSENGVFFFFKVPLPDLLCKRLTGDWHPTYLMPENSEHKLTPFSTPSPAITTQLIPSPLSPSCPVLLPLPQLSPVTTPTP